MLYFQTKQATPSGAITNYYNRFFQAKAVTRTMLKSETIRTVTIRLAKQYLRHWFTCLLSDYQAFTLFMLTGSATIYAWFFRYTKQSCR